MVEIGKIYKIYTPNRSRQIDEVKVTKIVGTAFYCYSNRFDYETAYDTSDGIICEEVNADDENFIS